jgi:hypothetical protein|tara:strand:+ start:201 stop:554 length:354 start_codon:yes stop_codon:yes gene_type:complete
MEFGSMFILEIIGATLFFSGALFGLNVLAVQYCIKNMFEINELNEVNKDDTPEKEMEIMLKIQGKNFGLSMPDNSPVWEVTNAMQELLIEAGFSKKVVQKSFTVHPSKLYGDEKGKA